MCFLKMTVLILWYFCIHNYDKGLCQNQSGDIVKVKHMCTTYINMKKPIKGSQSPLCQLSHTVVS